MDIINGRPANCEGRLPKEIRTYDLLDRLGISYQQVDHPPAMTMEQCREVDEAFATPMCKNLMLCNRQNTAFYLLMLPGDKVFKTKDLTRQIGSSRLSFASGEYMEELLDITPGSLSVLGLANDTDHRVQLLIDEDVLQADSIVCHPCINTSSLRLDTKDVMDKLLPATGHTPVIVRLETPAEDSE